MPFFSNFIEFIEEISFAAQDPFSFALWLFLKTWVFFIIGFIVFGGPALWLEYLRNKYDSKRKFSLLAIDVPKNNEQSPLAVENIFSQLAGISASPSRYETWVQGKMPESFSLEIVSMGGYIQFLIQTPEEFRDMVEAAVYAQYPDAEIVEVEDYAQKTRGLKFPNSEYDMWGTEFQLFAKEHIPIKLYKTFEHQMSQEFKDPMAAIMEAMSKLTPDEQVWLQLVITPASDSWKDEGEFLIKKLAGENIKQKKTLLDKTSDFPLQAIDMLGNLLSYAGEEKKTQNAGPPNKMQFLTPDQREKIDSIALKISKIGFYTKFRMIYIARKSAFRRSRGIYSMVGGIKQFNIIGGNGFKTSKNLTPKVDYFFKNWRNNSRKNKVLKFFRNRARDLVPRYYGYVLNIEELASLYHFPLMNVRTPLLKKIEIKKYEPPSTLPVETAESLELPVEKGETKT